MKVARILLFVVVTLYFSTIVKANDQDAYLTTIVSQKAIEYMTTIAKAKLQEKLQGIMLQDASYEIPKTLPLLKPKTLEVKEIVIDRISLTDADIKLVDKSGMKFTIKDSVVNVSFNWGIRSSTKAEKPAKDSKPIKAAKPAQDAKKPGVWSKLTLKKVKNAAPEELTKRSSLKVTASIDFTIKVVAKKGKTTIDIVSFNANMEQFDLKNLKMESKWAWVLPPLNKVFNIVIKEQIVGIIQTQFTALLEAIKESHLSKPMVLPVPLPNINNLQVDMSTVGAFNSDKHVAVSSKVHFVMDGTPMFIKEPYKSLSLKGGDYFRPDSSMQVFISSRAISSFLKSIQRSDEPLFIAPISELYSGAAFNAAVRALKLLWTGENPHLACYYGEAEPEVTFLQNLGARIKMNPILKVHSKQDGDLKPSSITLNLSVDVGINPMITDDGKLSFSHQINAIEINIPEGSKWNKVKTILDAGKNVLIRRYLDPYISKFAMSGYQLPNHEIVRFAQPQIVVRDGYLDISGNILFDIGGVDKLFDKQLVSMGASPKLRNSNNSLKSSRGE